jgi:hypothetical protein
VAVRAQQRQVLEAVVLPVAVDVMELEGDRSAEPVPEAAGVTATRHQSKVHQAFLEVVAITRRREELLDRHAMRARADLATILEVVRIVVELRRRSSGSTVTR